ncbi:SpoIIE family protein phosphatase [candidate division CSSED10-310 bacterium]|uniref:SpoIIE family protein phosphatase n=1 Tax=candidate division CSSED10-310 bacterium TaxID=2855610 RepID=A0ABV6YX16_UNCC1
MGTLKIKINSNWCKQRQVHLDKDEIRIGRTPDNDIIFTHQCVSRSHASIVKENDQFFIEDKQSKHGTFVNKIRITRQIIKHNDIIHLGLVRETEMRLSHDIEPDTTPGLNSYEISSIAERSEFLYKDLQYKDLQILLEISRAINSTLVLQDVLNLVMDAAVQLTKAEKGFLMLFDDEGQLEFQAARNMKQESLDERDFKISRSIVNKVAETGEALISGNILQDDRFKAQRSVLELQLKTVMCVPLKIISAVSSEVIGFIYIDNEVITPQFSKKTLDFLDYMASHAAIAIRNAKLLEETRIKERMQKELEIAYQIQTSLFPQIFPDLPGLEIYARSIPAAEVGGDFYNFIQLEPKQMGVAIGDVIGKSIPAALYMSATYSILETLLHIRKNLSPQEVIITLNSIMCQKTKGSHFVTFSYGILDLDQFTFTFSNAGHNYPVLLREGKCTELQCNGPALGMFDEDQFDSLSVSLLKGDYLIFFTDGMVEALDSNKVMYGFDRLTQTIIDFERTSASAQDLGASILKEVQSHYKGSPQFDDMTLLCLHLN